MESQAAPAKKSAMRLQGVFMRAQPSAMINGKDVAEGDFLDGNKVVKIEASRVVLQNPQGELFNVTYQ